jgi:hypothetical protein
MAPILVAKESSETLAHGKRHVIAVNETHPKRLRLVTFPKDQCK